MSSRRNATWQNWPEAPRGVKPTRRLSFLVQFMQNATQYAAVADMSMLGGVHALDQALAM